MTQPVLRRGAHGACLLSLIWLAAACGGDAAAVPCGADASSDLCAEVNCGSLATCAPATGDCVCDNGVEDATVPPTCSRCTGVTCVGESSCVEDTGTCVCDVGYAGAACDEPWSVAYGDPGSWNATDTVTASTAGTALGVVTYIASSSPRTASKIRITGMSGFADSIIDVDLTTATEFVIDATDPNGRVFTGSGTLGPDGDALTVSYTVLYSDATTDTITGVWELSF